MKKIVRGISILVALAVIIGIMQYAIPASAAVSSWEFRTKAGAVIAVSSSIQMKKNEFQDFNLFKSGSEIAQNNSRYDVIWSSSDESVVWIDANNGKARADKFKTMSGETGEATISVRIRNKQTQASIVRKFTVKVGVKEKAEVAKLEIKFVGDLDPTEAFEIGNKYSMKSYTYDKDGKMLTFAQTGLYRKFFGEGINGSNFIPTKEGIYKITVGAYKTKAAMNQATTVDNAVMKTTIEVYVGSDETNNFEVKQTTMNKVELTFTDTATASKIVNKNDLLLAYFYIDELEVMNPISSIELKSGDSKTIVVTMHMDFTENTKYKFVYNGDTKIEKAIIGAGISPAYIEVVNKSCVVEKDTLLEVKFFNAAGVDITSYTSQSVMYSAPESTDYYIVGDSLVFFNANKTAVIKATVDMGYDSNGNKLKDLVATGVYTSIAKALTAPTKLSGYAIASTRYSAPSSLTYRSTSTDIITVNDTGLSLFASYQYVDDEKKMVTHYIAGGDDLNPANLGDKYTYSSSNDTVLMIDAVTGELHPVNTGKTTLIIKDMNNVAVGVLNITVASDRVFSTFNLSPSGQRLSATGLTYNDYESIILKISANDQYGKSIDPSAIEYNYEITSPANSVFENLFNAERVLVDANETLDIKLTEGSHLVDGISQGATKTFRIRVTATVDTKSMYRDFVVTVKNTAFIVAAPTIELNIDKTSIDTKLNKDYFNEYNVILQARGIDSGYLVDVKDMKIVGSTADIDKSTGAYTLLLQRGNDTSPNDWILQQINENNRADKQIVLKPVSKNASSGEVMKAPTGTYYASLYVGTGSAYRLLQQKKQISISDSSTAIIVEQKETRVDSVSSEDILKALTFKRGGVDISEFVTIHDMDYITVNDRLVIRTLDINVHVCEMNEKLASLQDNVYSVVEDVAVNKSFIIN